MKVTVTLAFLSLLIVSTGYFTGESFAEISENQGFVLEGSGFAVTEEIIRTSEIDLGLSSQDQRGSTINFATKDGFITLDDEEFIVSNLEGKFLREGKYIRINGDIESSNGFDTSISFFGRLVDESKDAAVYGFTGRITTPDNIYKIIYTTKLSSLSQIITTPAESEQSGNLAIHILKGASSKGVSDNYIVTGKAQTTSDPARLSYFSHDRISVEPGTTITLVNDDDVPHRIVSGIVVGSERGLENGNICTDVDVTLKEGFSTFGEGSEVYDCDFVVDKRIDTDTILSGESVSVTFDELGFYRLLDPDYGWMRIVAYVFPNTDDVVLGTTGKNLGN